MTYQQQYQRPLTLQIDLNQATYQAFLNCINSFQGLETESEMRSSGGAAISTMSSKVSLERFIYNLGVLAGLRGGNGYDVEMGPSEAFKFWNKTVKEMRDGDFFKQPRKEAHI